jgi:dihydroorotase
LSAPAPENGRKYDLLVRGGNVVDPATGTSGSYDVAVAGGRVAEVAPEVPSHLAAEVVDATGAFVVPGLIDLHAHVFCPGTFWGVDPRPVAWRSGVTSWVDAGSAGAYNLRALRQLSDAFAPLHTRAFINVSAIGLVAETGEARRDELCDAALAVAVIEDNREFVVGVKCRMDRFSTGDMGLVPLERAIQAAGAAGLPVMAHIGGGPPDIDEVLERLRPGDIVTHCYTGRSMALMDKAGKPRRSAARAKERGVLLDVGHGGGSFSFAVAEQALASGLLPHVISSDLHQQSVLGPCFDLPTCMSKFLALGMSLEDVVRATTVNPARAIGLAPPAASLAIGAPADLAVFELEMGDFALYDTLLNRRRADRLLVNRATVTGGVVLPPVAPAWPEPWAPLTDQQAAVLGRRLDELRRPWAISLNDPSAFTGWPVLGPPG